MGRAAKFLIFLGLVCKSTIVPLLCFQQELGQGFHADQPDKKNDGENQADECKGIKDDPEALPALALRVVEDLFGHQGVRCVFAVGFALGSILSREESRVNEMVELDKLRSMMQFGC